MTARFCSRSMRCSPACGQDRARCSQAWDNRQPLVDDVGGDPARHIALGVGYGLERVAMLRHGIDDIRKIDVTSAANADRSTAGRGRSPTPLSCSVRPRRD